MTDLESPENNDEPQNLIEDFLKEVLDGRLEEGDSFVVSREDGQVNVRMVPCLSRVNLVIADQCPERLTPGQRPGVAEVLRHWPENKPYKNPTRINSFSLWRKKLMITCHVTIGS